MVFAARLTFRFPGFGLMIDEVFRVCASRLNSPRDVFSLFGITAPSPYWTRFKGIRLILPFIPHLDPYNPYAPRIGGTYGLYRPLFGSCFHARGSSRNMVGVTQFYDHTSDPFRGIYAGALGTPWTSLEFRRGAYPPISVLP